MALASAQVVAALAARLGAMPSTAGRVYTSRSWPLADGGLPAWRVYVDDEPVERVGMDSSLHRHLPEVRAVGYVAATADLDDALNAMAAGGLALLFAAPAPYALELVGISRGMATEGEARLGTVTLTVRAEFYADAAAPETILS